MTYAPEHLDPDEGDEPESLVLDDEDTEPDSAVPALVTYEVVGPQPVDEVAPGGSLDLSPIEPRTVRLLERGQIVRVDPNKED